MMKMPTLVRPVRAHTNVVKGIEAPTGRIIEIPRADLWVGSSDGPLTLAAPYFGDASGSTVVRAWIGVNDRGQQWWPAEGGPSGDTGITGTQKILMAEGFDGGYGYADWNQHYWVGDWPPGSYPTPWPSAEGWWGTRKAWPVPSGGNASRVGCCGVDWNPYSQVLCCIMGEYNALWPGNGYHFTAFRSTDFGDTWTEIQDVTGTQPAFGYQANFSWYWDFGFEDFEQAQPRGDGLRYLGGTTWVYAFQDYGVYIWSEDDGLTWHYPGAAFMSDGTALRQDPNIDAAALSYYATNWPVYDGLFPNSVNTNWWAHVDDGVWRNLCSYPTTYLSNVFGCGEPKVCYTNGIGANQWHVAAEAYSQDNSQGPWWHAGIPPYVTDGNFADLIYGSDEAVNYAFVPGTSGNRWVYIGSCPATHPLACVIPNDNFRPSTALQAIGSSHFIVSSTFQQNVYTGWAYTGSPSSYPIYAAAVVATPHPTSVGQWRVWAIEADVLSGYCRTICYSDDQGTTWGTKADYSKGGAIFRNQWCAAGQHPFFFPGQAPGSVYVSDIAWHPSDPKNLLSIGYANSTVGYCMAASYDGGNTWDDLVQFNKSTSGGPARAMRLVPLYTAPGSLVTPDKSREALNDATFVVVHAPAVNAYHATAVVGPAVAVLAVPELAAPAGGARTVSGASTLVLAPQVTTNPICARAATAGMVLVAPAASVGGHAVAASVVVVAPAAVGYQNAAIGHYRAVSSAGQVVNAPAVT